MRGVVDTLAGVHAAIWRPFRQRVDLELIVLLLLLAVTLAGGWHLVLENVELGGVSEEPT